MDVVKNNINYLVVTKEEVQALLELVEASKSCLDLKIYDSLHLYDSLLRNNYKIYNFNLKDYKSVIERDKIIFNFNMDRSGIEYDGKTFVRWGDKIKNEPIHEANRSELDHYYGELKKIIKEIRVLVKQKGLEDTIKIMLEDITKQDSLKDGLIRSHHQDMRKLVKFYNKILDTFFTTFAKKYVDRGICGDDVSNNDFYNRVVDTLTITTLYNIRANLYMVYRNAYTPLIHRIVEAGKNLRHLKVDIESGKAATRGYQKYDIKLIVK